MKIGCSQIEKKKFFPIFLLTVRVQLGHITFSDTHVEHYTGIHWLRRWRMGLDIIEREKKKDIENEVY